MDFCFSAPANLEWRKNQIKTIKKTTKSEEQPENQIGKKERSEEGKKGDKTKKPTGNWKRKRKDEKSHTHTQTHAYL